MFFTFQACNVTKSGTKLYSSPKVSCTVDKMLNLRGIPFGKAGLGFEFDTRSKEVDCINDNGLELAPDKLNIKAG